MPGSCSGMKDQQAERQADVMALRRELDAADQTRAQHTARARVASLTMQSELHSAEQQLSFATALTNRTLADAQEGY